jgi:hypothetical protein
MGKIKEALPKVASIFTIIIIFTLIYTICGNKSTDWYGIDSKEDIGLFNKFFNRFYFTTTTMSTAGFGDISPKTQFLRSIVIIQFFIILTKLFLIFNPEN